MADRYTFNGAATAAMPWKSPTPMAPRRLRPVDMDRELMAVHPDGSIMFQSPCEPGTNNCLRPVLAGDITHADGGGVFAGRWPVHQAQIMDGRLWWVTIGDDAR